MYVAHRQKNRLYLSQICLPQSQEQLRESQGLLRRQIVCDSWTDPWIFQVDRKILTRRRDKCHLALRKTGTGDF